MSHELLLNKKIKASNLDELSLYLELRKQERLLENQSHNMMILPKNDDKMKLQEEIYNTEQTIQVYLENLQKFGIHPNDPEEVLQWRQACSDFLNRLGMLEYTILFNLQVQGRDLSNLFPSQDQTSFFLSCDQDEEIPKKISKKLTTMKIS